MQQGLYSDDLGPRQDNVAMGGGDGLGGRGGTDSGQRQAQAEKRTLEREQSSKRPANSEDVIVEGQQCTIKPAITDKRWTWFPKPYSISDRYSPCGPFGSRLQPAPSSSALGPKAGEGRHRDVAAETPEPAFAPSKIGEGRLQLVGSEIRPHDVGKE